MKIVSLFGATSCNPLDSAKSFLGFPHWFEYLRGTKDALGKCVPSFDVDRPGDLWGIALALADILLYIVGLVSVAYIMYAGFLYITSSGEPERTKNAKDTMLNALIGLVIAIIASTIVAFIGSKII